MGRKSREKRERQGAPTVWPVPNPQPTPEQLARILAVAGLAGPPEDGVLTLDTATAWRADPWLWFPTRYQQTNLPDPPLTVFVSQDYQVSLYEANAQGGWPAMWHLSIKRRDRQPLEVEPQGRWRILQRVKNTLVGSEHEGIELYPAEARLVDTANQYHLFVLKDPSLWFPFGFQERLVAGQGSHGAVQRPFEDDRPTDDARVEARMTDLFGPR